MFLFLFFGIVVVSLVLVDCVMIKKECPNDEVHKSCAFHEEYACWKDADRLTRVKSPPKRLMHCRSGCYCKKGLVRAFPGGICVMAAACRDRNLKDVLLKLPGFHMYK